MKQAALAADIARATGVSPRTVRARLAARGIAAAGRGNAQPVPAEVATEVVRELGRAHAVGGLSRVQVLVAYAVMCTPGGVEGAAQVAAKTGLSYNTCRAALDRLAALGLTTTTPRTVIRGGKTTRVPFTELSDAAWADHALMAELDTVRLPWRPPAARQTRVPRRFHHLFWNADPGQLDVSEHGAFIALRLLEAGDLDAATWALANVPAPQLRRVLEIRGVNKRIRSFIANHLELRCH